MKIEKKGWLVIGVVVVVVVVFLLKSCGREPQPEEPLVRPVKMLKFGAAQTGAYRAYPGRVQADQTADLAFEDPGRLVELPVKRGQDITKGELLARIDPRDFKNAVAARKAEFVEARADLDRYRKLYEDDAVPVADLEVRQRKFDVAKAKMKVAEKALGNTSLVAPFTGVIARKFVDNFQDVKAKQPIVRLQDITKLEVVINIPETDVIRAPEKDPTEAGARDVKAFAEFDSVPDRRFPLRLKEFESEADPQTQTFLVKFTMPSPKDVNIAPGMTATVKIDMGSLRAAPEDMSVVPVNAVFSGPAGKNYVWVVDQPSMTVKRREVTVGKLTNGDIQILGGLKDGETIVTTGVYQLEEGSKVRPYERLMEVPTR